MAHTSIAFPPDKKWLANQWLMAKTAACLSRRSKPVKIGVKNKSKRENNMRIRIIALSAALILIAGAAMAQGEGGTPAEVARGGAAAGSNRTAPANAIKPGSMIVAHGHNGFGASYPYPGLYRENGGNGLYGPTTGAYFGQFEQNGSL
jgi:hypothetical protein